LDPGLQLSLDEHYVQIKKYRANAKHHQMLACLYPEKYISISQDGTDQLGYGYPKLPEFNKEQDNFRMKTKIMISIAHGTGVWEYIMPENVKGDANCSIECLQRTLKSVELRDGRLPPTLFFQVDNCFREAKNTYMLAYLSWLVERKVFKEVYISFHPSGQHSPFSFQFNLAHPQRVCISVTMCVCYVCRTHPQ
jgi:hypothetical protein